MNSYIGKWESRRAMILMRNFMHRILKFDVDFKGRKGWLLRLRIIVCGCSNECNFHEKCIPTAFKIIEWIDDHFNTQNLYTICGGRQWKSVKHYVGHWLMVVVVASTSRPAERTLTPQQLPLSTGSTTKWTLFEWSDGFIPCLYIAPILYEIFGIPWKFKFSRHLADGILSKTIMPSVNLIYCWFAHSR